MIKSEYVDTGVEQLAPPLEAKPSTAYGGIRVRLVAAIGLQIVALTALGAPKAYTYVTGAPIVLRAHTVDPRDFFRGDYVTLEFDISKQKPQPDKFEVDDKVYVVLKPNGMFYTSTGVSKEKPELKLGEAMIKGKVEYSNDERLQIDYGLERAYIAEGTGRGLEGDNLKVEVMVDAAGESVLRTVKK